MSNRATICHLTLASVSMLRLPLPLKPKRLEASKLLASCFSKTLHESQLTPGDCWWFSDEPLAADLPAEAGWGKTAALCFSPHNPLGLLTKLLASCREDVSLLYYSSLTAPVSALIRRYSLAACQLYPDLLQESLARRQHALSPRAALSSLAPSMEAAFVVQEKPGKMLVVNPWQELERSRRLPANSRSLAAGSNASLQLASFSLPAGWGACAALLSPSRKPAAGVRSLACSVFHATPSEQAISLPLKLAEELAGWLASLGHDRHETLGRLMIIAPTLPLAALLEAAFARLTPPLRYDDEACTPDFVLGWAPLLTFIDFLNSSGSPKGHLLVDASQFPRLEAFYLGPAGREARHGS